MHVHARLGKVVGDDAREHRFQFGILCIAERGAEVFGDVPLREQAHLAQQQGFVIGRQFVFARRELYPDQRVGGCAIQVARIGCCQCLQVGGVAEIGQQQETLRQILCIHMRYVRSGILE